MINLIPPHARKSVVREYWLRVITVWLFLFGTGCLIVSVLLLPTYMLVRGQTATLGDQVSATADRTASYDEATAKLKAATTQATFLKNTASSTPFSTYLKILESIAGAGVTLHSVSYTHPDGGVGKITISGVATTRTVLASFRDALEADPAFTGVVLPINALTKASDLIFSMDMTLATTP